MPDQHGSVLCTHGSQETRGSAAESSTVLLLQGYVTVPEHGEGI